MADNAEDELTPEELDAKFAKMKAAMHAAQLERGAATRKQKERAQHKKRVNSRLLLRHWPRPAVHVPGSRGPHQTLQGSRQRT